MSSTPNSAPGYTGLTELTEGLPAEAYFDPLRYERELQRIWYRNWVYVGRSGDVARARAFRTFELGDQKILLVRDDQGLAVRAASTIGPGARLSLEFADGRVGATADADRAAATTATTTTAPAKPAASEPKAAAPKRVVKPVGQGSLF